MYAVGIDDTYLILFCIVLFTGLRAGTMESILAPLGKLQGITNRKELTRFTEQGWMIVYYTFFWSLGVVSLLNTSKPVGIQMSNFHRSISTPRRHSS